jgi:hypothetical protein
MLTFLLEYAYPTYKLFHRTLFPALKRLKSYLRSTFSKNRLTTLSILHIEAELLNDDRLNYEVCSMSLLPSKQDANVYERSAFFSIIILKFSCCNMLIL